MDPAARHDTVQRTAMFPQRTESLLTAHSQNLRLTVAYDGTDYFGWQIQPGLPTIQGALAEAVRKITGEAVLPQGSGRTDTGVHAEGQVVSLALCSAIPADRLHRALNRRLPPAIRVLSLKAVPAAFHARGDVLHKTYEYRIFERRRAGIAGERICHPREARFAWDCRWPLDLRRMQCAAAALAGTHDFTSFAARDPDRMQRLEGNDNGNCNVRTIFASAWEREGDLLLYRVKGNGFLHHMVRNIVGTCVEIGACRMEPEDLPRIVAAHDRGEAAMTAPPQGLHLLCVTYAADVERTCGLHGELANTWT